MHKFTWSKGDEIRFLHALNGRDILDVLEDNFDSDLSNQLEIDNCAENFSKILQNAAKKASIKHRLTGKRSDKHKKHNIKHSKPWPNHNCRQLKQLHERFVKNMREAPNNLSLVYEVRRIRKLYKTCRNYAKRSYEQNIWRNLDSLEKSNPRQFWKLFSDLKGLNDSYKTNPIPLRDWVDHFTHLLSGAFKPDGDLSSHIDKYLSVNRDKFFNQLNFIISTKEVSDAIDSLKLNKSAGADGLLNEMLKAGKAVLLPFLHKLFKRIFSTGFYPMSWRTNTLSPLHKKGDLYSTGNYRGIAVGTCISKLFLSILHKRLMTFVDANNIIPNVQIGYKKNSSTSDHILTLKNIIDKYILRASRTYLFTCFVDFKSAFDTVWRKALLYKLLKSGIGGNILNIIESMYASVFYCVKLNGCLSDKIPSDVGVKQGCVLSPLLFNIFLSDLPCIFEDSCDPVTLLDSSLSCLMFADDLFIHSETSRGFQNALNKLNAYCQNWGLTINTSIKAATSFHSFSSS